MDKATGKVNPAFPSNVIKSSLAVVGLLTFQLPVVLSTASAADTSNEAAQLPVEHTHLFSRTEANKWYAEGWCEHLVDLRVRALAAPYVADDYKSLAVVIDNEVPRAGGNSAVVNAIGWLQESEDGDTMWRPFAEIEIMNCDIDESEASKTPSDSAAREDSNEANATP